jgi:hypothetical protein
MHRGGRHRGVLICALVLATHPVTHAGGPDGPEKRSWGWRTVELLGTVTAFEPVNVPPAQSRWRVTVKVDRLLFGSLTTPTFTFGMDARFQTPKVGGRYRVETSGWRTDDLAEMASPLYEPARSKSLPFAGAIGYAAVLRDRKSSAIMVAFGTTKALPARDAIVTLVAADASMRATRSRFACAEHDDHDNDIAVHLEPITTPEWLARQHVAGTYPRVAVLAGDLPAARALAPKTIARTDLPKGTRTQLLIVAVDADGDDHPDFVARRACENGTECEEYFCEEVWAKIGAEWRPLDRTCGD